MGFLMNYFVPGIVGGLCSIFLEKVAKVALKFGEEMLESPENMVDTITQNSLQRVKEQSIPISYIHKWYKDLDEQGLRKASGMVEGMVEEHLEWWNICSCYRRRKAIANIKKHLKLVPLIQLDCVISKLREILAPPQPVLFPPPVVPMAPTIGFIQAIGLISGMVGAVIGLVLKVMFLYIGRFYNFPKKLKSFKYLLNEMNRVIYNIKDGINEIQRVNDASNWLNNASNWVDEMNAIIKKGERINDTCSPIARCRKSKEITKLISEIDAHLEKLSWINLDLLFHEIKRPRSHPLSPQIERPRSHPPPPQETEGSTSHRPPSQETEGCTSQRPQALPDYGVCPHYNYVPGGVCPHYVCGFCPHYNYVPRGFCPHYNYVGHDPCSTM